MIGQNDDGIDRSLRVLRNAARNDATWYTSADDRRSSSVTVKKNIPPGMKLRRYRTIHRL
jgi:hypothetical protein